MFFHFIGELFSGSDYDNLNENSAVKKSDKRISITPRNGKLRSPRITPVSETVAKNPNYTPTISILPTKILSEKEIPEVKIPEVKALKKEKPTSKMKSWPDNGYSLLLYVDLIRPIKEILMRGYRLLRKEEVKSFDYEGFNIGKEELKNSPSPKTRFSEKFIEQEKKNGHSVLDIALNTVFLLGVEQGRRAERRDNKPTEQLLDTLNIYREKNKDLRIRVDELEIYIDLKNENLSNEEFQLKLKNGIEDRRIRRIEELKSELKMDVSRSNFQFHTPIKAKFKELEWLAKSLTKANCTQIQWSQILSERGWTLKEWKEKCKDKSSSNDFA